MAMLRHLGLAASLPLVFAQAPHESAAELAAEHAADVQNWKIVHITAWTWAAIIAVLLAYRIAIDLLHYSRRIVNLEQDSKQRFFVYPGNSWARIKRHLLLAPLFRTRHNREFRLSAAVNMGVLPSRIEFVFLFGYLIMNIVTAAVHIDWSNAEAFYQQAFVRFGVLSTLNLIPLFLLAGRNNPLIRLLDISFNTYNLFHRWIGRIVVFEAFLHAAFWAAGYIHTMGSRAGWQHVIAATSYPFIYSGLIGLVAFVALLLQSPSLIRHAFYETFWHLHFLLAILAVVGVWIHLDGLPQKTFLLAALAFWIVERALRFWSLIRRNVGRGVTKVEVEALPGDAMRVTLRVARPWQLQPGQHLYLCIPSVGLWSSHPFSIAWSQDVPITRTGSGNEKTPLPTTTQDLALLTTNTTSTSLSLLIRRRTGFTNKLYTRTTASPNSKLHTTALIEGPYSGSTASLGSYGTVVLFAAGVGIAHQLPYIRSLLSAYAAGTTATRRISLIWTMQAPEHLEWVRPWMSEILAMPHRREVLRIQLFVTRPRSTREMRSPSSTVLMFPGRPDVRSLIVAEQKAQVGGMVVSVCGTGGLSDDVRKVVREVGTETVVDFVEEAFSW